MSTGADTVNRPAISRTEDPIGLSRTWLKRARESQFSHYAAAARLERRHYWIGFPAVILSAAVGTSVFASLETQVDLRIKIAVGMLSVVAAILTGLQTFWRFSERAEKHRQTAANYAGLRRNIEEYIASPGNLKFEILDALRKRDDEIALQAPGIEPKDWATAKKTADENYWGAGL
jgi:hypothetical protein